MIFVGADKFDLPRAKYFQTLDLPLSVSFQLNGNHVVFCWLKTVWREKTGNLTAAEVKRRDRALRFADRAAKTGVSFRQIR
ncbi:MAG TPA: hypothetical protein PLK58_01335 [Candidatus Rifleibacterium sp.]|nr:hypothetical protein [Candidatus Rifleibacterium sp.]